MIQYHVYPNGKKRIVTFSYDDGNVLDEKLIEIFNRYGVKGTFHLNGMLFFDASQEKKEAFRARYAGHEISCHTLRHGWPSRMPMASVLGEVWEDRKLLEEVAQYPVRGMSYPSGSYSDDVCTVLRSCGIVYSRTTVATNGFGLPEDFLKWHPTCHHRAAMPLIEKFMSSLDSEWTGTVLYIWGHSHEFRTEQDWEYIEKLVASVAGSEKIWYATNIEIYDYCQAQKQLQISADETIFHNPTAIDVWVEKDKTQIIHIGAGQTVRL